MLLIEVSTGSIAFFRSRFTICIPKWQNRVFLSGQIRGANAVSVYEIVFHVMLWDWAAKKKHKKVSLRQTILYACNRIIVCYFTNAIFETKATIVRGNTIRSYGPEMCSRRANETTKAYLFKARYGT